MSVILWFIVIYLLFRFIFKFVIPLISATRTVQSKVNEMRQNMNGYQTTTSNGTTVESNSDNYKKSQASQPGSKGDYIDFEEIKE
jgi:hypothetical protein